MAKGRNATPKELKVIRGNPGRRPINALEIEPQTVGPYAPDFLDENAVLEWERLVPFLIKFEILNDLDLQVFANYCQAVSEKLDALTELRNEGATVESANGYFSLSAQYNRFNIAVKMELKLATELGLTPSSRTALKGSVQGVKKPVNDFTGF